MTSLALILPDTNLLDIAAHGPFVLSDQRDCVNLFNIPQPQGAILEQVKQQARGHKNKQANRQASKNTMEAVGIAQSSVAHKRAVIARVIPARGKPRQEDQEFRASLGYTRTCGAAMQWDSIPCSE